MLSLSQLSSDTTQRKPVPESSTSSFHTSPSSSTVPTMATGSATGRTSEDSKASSRFESGTASTSLSPIEQTSPLFENGFLDSTPPNKLHKAPAMPSWSPPPPPPPGEMSKFGSTPPKASAVTSTQPTPTRPRRPDRSPSPERPPSRAKLQPNRLQPRQPSPAPNKGGRRSVSAQPPAVRNIVDDGPRVASNPVHGATLSVPSGEPSPTTLDKKKRKSWFPGARSRANSDSAKPPVPSAWVMSPSAQVEYNTAPLVNGEKVPELWNETGNVYVYLHPKDSGRGPCFKVADHIFSHSAVLIELLVTEMMAGTSVGAGEPDVAPPTGPVTEGHLYLPLGNTDLERLVAARNLFALLTHQPLVGTTENPTLFAAILQVAGLLRRFNFSSFDGSSFGESVDAAFDVLMDHTGLADLRRSREKTLEALILSEQMKSWNLYNEAFAHAVGKYESLQELKSPLYERISVSTRQRLERAHLDLVNRQANVNGRLESFEFPSLFSGIASSTSTEEYRNVKFKEWRNSFSKMRSFALSYYKGLFGNWPPRARSKKNQFSQSGLNRQCLKILYSDLCALYDLLVDRQSLTPRVIGETHEDPTEDSKENKKPGEAEISALRRVLSEFDKSSPPVLPPIPYDVPKLPSMTAIYENYNELPAKKQAKYSKALQPHELQLILIKSYNMDADALNSPFLTAYKEFELKEAKSIHPSDLQDQRIGHWLFLYVVLQSLPMLVVDAPGLRYTEGVEDFLCEAPQGNPPWTEDAHATRKMWFQTGNSNVVELSADVVMFSVEGIYMRSHCWLAAKEWEAASASGGALPPSTSGGSGIPQETISPLQPPRAVFRDMDPFASSSPTTASHPAHRSQSPAGGASPPSSGAPSPHLRPNHSPHLRPRSGSTNDRAHQAFRASIAIGLEPLPLPTAPSLGHQRGSRVLSLGSMSMSSSGGGGTGSPVSGPGTAPSLGPSNLSDVYSPQQSLATGSSMGSSIYSAGGLRASRSAVCLSPSAGSLPGSDYMSQGRKSSYGGGFGPVPINTSFGGGPGGGGAGASAGPSNLGPGGPGPYGNNGGMDSPVGGSTFDDILKGMDGKGKKKKKLFF